MQTFARKPKTSKRSGRGRGVPALAGKLNRGRQAGSASKQDLPSPVSSGAEVGGASLANRVRARSVLNFGTSGPADHLAGVQFVPATWAGKARMHVDTAAAVAAQTRQADAYTQGGHIYFDAGRYRPDLPSGRHLLLHELVHVAQQGNAGSPASTAALEAEADRVATDAVAGRSSRVRLSASPEQALHQQTNWATGDVFADAEAAKQIKNQGGLFSGNDQAHVNVSAKGKLAYDSSYTTPEDGFRWSKLKELVDGGHVKIAGVSRSDTFKMKDTATSPVVDRSITEIGMIVGDIGVMGITLAMSTQSPDPAYTMIYYDKDQGIGALTHELFGHAWLEFKQVPSAHPPAKSAAEKAIGTLAPSHGITDPFGSVFAGTVHDYIATYVESLGSKAQVSTSAGAKVTVPKSPTQQVGQDAVVKTFADLHKEASGKLTKNSYTAEAAQAWRILCNNYDVMQKHKDSEQAGNSNFMFTKEVMVVLCYLLFDSWSKDTQAGFRILLADYTLSRSGFTPNELSNNLQALVGAAPGLFSPGSSMSP